MTSPHRSSLRHRNDREYAFEPLAARLTLLGGFELQCGQRVARVPPHVERLLAFLALHDRPLRRAYVSGRLWIDVSQEQAFGSLRTTLWRMHSVRAWIVEATTTQLSLAPSVGVDVRELKASVQRALHRRTQLDPSDFDLLTQAEELLPDWYDDWVAQEREQLAKLRLLALEAACEELVAAGKFMEATTVALAAVAADPLRESARTLLIRAYLGAGDRVEAAREFIEFRRQLKSELGLEPSLRMLEFVQALGSG